MFSYSKEAMLAARKLDEINMINILVECKRNGTNNVYDIIDELDDCLDGVGELLAELTTDEFMLYLGERYGVSFEEVVSYKMVSIIGF